MKKARIVKGPRKPPKHARNPLEVAMEICVDCIEDYEGWVECNRVTLSRAFAHMAYELLRRGDPIPSLKEFDTFCRYSYSHCLALAEQETATVH